MVSNDVNPPQSSETSNDTVPPTEFTDKVDLEDLFFNCLNESNKVAKSEKLTTENATAKMLNYCIRMLHAHDWFPPTVIRAMVLQEMGEKKSIKRALKQAMNERRQESEDKRAGGEHSRKQST